MRWNDSCGLPNLDTAHCLQLASLARVQDGPHLLRVVAAVVVHGVRVASIPEHDTTEARVALVLVEHALQRRRLDVISAAARGPRRRIGRRGQPDEQRRALGHALRDVAAPLIEVEAAGATAGLVQVGGAGGVVVELDEELVELRGGDHGAHVGLGDGALRRAGDGVFVLGVRREEGAQLGDEGGVVLVAAGVGLDVEVEAVDEGLAEGAGPAGLGDGGVREGVEEFGRDALGVALRVDLAGARGAANGDVDLLAGLLAGGDVGLEGGAGRAVAELALAAEAAGEAAGGVLGDEGQDDDVDALAGLAVLTEAALAVFLALVVRASGWGSEVVR